jgi:phospholipid/cholesterol/gamma-HCH transport system substrate-binding protein
MRARKKDTTNFMKVGVFITGLTIILMVMIISIGKENSVFDKKIDLKARVREVVNLKEGSPIELKGIRIGTVKAIEILSEDEVEITLNILEKQLKWIKKDSKVSVSTAGLVGDKYLEIYNGTKDSPKFNPEKDILVSEDVADLKKIITKGESIATITERILLKVDQLLYNIDDGKKIVQSINSISKASINLEQITKDLKDAQLGTVSKNISTTMTKLNKSAASMERIMTRIESGPGTMNSLIYSDDVHEELRALLGGANRNKVIKYFIRESIKNSEQKKPVN